MGYYNYYYSWRSTPRKTWVIDSLPYDAREFLLDKVLWLPDCRWYRYTEELGRRYGPSAEEYANRTRYDWQDGTITPSNKTKDRLLKIAPKFLDQQDKNYLVELIAQRYLVKPKKESFVYQFDADRPIEPQLQEAKKRIEDFAKPMQPQMPAIPDELFGALTWLYENDAKAIQAVLALLDAQKANAVDAITLRSVPSSLNKIVEFYNSGTIGNMETSLEFERGTYSLSISRRPPPDLFESLFDSLGIFNIILLPFLPFILLLGIFFETVRGIFKNE